MKCCLWMNVYISLLDYCGHTYLSCTQFSFYQDEMFCSLSNLHFFFHNLFSTYIISMCMCLCVHTVCVTHFIYNYYGNHKHFGNRIINFQLCEFVSSSPWESSLLLVTTLKWSKHSIIGYHIAKELEIHK